MSNAFQKKNAKKIKEKTKQKHVDVFLVPARSVGY